MLLFINGFTDPQTISQKWDVVAKYCPEIMIPMLVLLALFALTILFLLIFNSSVILRIKDKKLVEENRKLTTLVKNMSNNGTLGKHKADDCDKLLMMLKCTDEKIEELERSLHDCEETIRLNEIVLYDYVKEYGLEMDRDGIVENFYPEWIEELGLEVSSDGNEADEEDTDDKEPEPVKSEQIDDSKLSSFRPQQKLPENITWEDAANKVLGEKT